ncbi:unnamed protein product [Rotaria sordida]|uniref:Uncharacterized protein n=1 Tax=Rotaria sordida TaxID=392033 RepID=A0A815C074_9BILA|nr:unnamed protein product [Rotaria sordida]CAF3965978.1 unnamed protein product [Rotaria sordida]
MAHALKEKILSILSLYLSKECPAYAELIQQVANISDEKFIEPLNKQSSSTIERVMFLLDNIIYFVNEYYQINRQQGQELDRIINEIKSILIDTINDNQTMKKKIFSLETDIKYLKNENYETKRYRTTVEILTPIVRQIRTTMVHQGIPDFYYSKIIINAYILRAHGDNISWEIADFNDNYPQTQFDSNTFDQLELIIKNIASTLRIDYDTLLELLYMKLDRNEVKHDSIKNFLRYNANGNSSFNAYLNSMGIADVFTINEKMCLEILYKNHFVAHYNAIH